MSRVRIRETMVIESEIMNVVDQLQKHRESINDENIEKLIQQNIHMGSYSHDSSLQMVTISNPYNDNINYYKEYWRFYMLNEIQIKTLNEMTLFNQRLNELTEELGNLQSELTESLQQKQKKKNRRTSQEIHKPFVCPYEQCNKIYGSDVSLNLHIKLKHDGGNKTDREKYARMIIEAQENGTELPEVNIKFPPGYLEVREQSKKEKCVRSQKTTKEVNQVSIFYDDE